ncbi:glutamate receptor 3.7 [Citrus sinensis]|nr:glutamate receptor 3.7 [Citrus sinensis]
MISEVANGLKVPLVSFAATDPTLSALQFPYFIRSTQSDSQQMAAMADLIDFYGWKEVIAIYVDDDYGRNGISALSNMLEKNMAKVSYKLPLPVQFNQHDITVLLNNSKPLGPRVYVVHVSPDPGLRIFTTAQKLQMMTNNYVWLATDWLSATLESFSKMNQTSLRILQGVVGLRQHTPDSIPKKAFLSRWSGMQQKGLVSAGLNTYGLYAYDTVWAVARSIDKFINEHNITFSASHELPDSKATRVQLEQLKVFDGGTFLLRKLLQTNFTGLSGQVQFNQDRNIVSRGYDVINIDKMEIHRVGYWFDGSGFSVLPPETLKGKNVSHSQLDWKLQNITWPGGKTETPRGWVIADNARPLRIGVPRRASFVGFVTEEHDSHKVQGYCIDIFLEALKLVPYDVPYKFELFGDGLSNPSYDGLVKMVANDVFDAAVGDIAIVTNRTKIVDFSQPYISTGLVIVAPINNHKASAWVFLKPFTVEMWCVTAASFVMIAVVIWILEHRVNDDFRGPPRRQIATMFLFSFSTLFKTNQEATVSSLGRFVMVVWLFLLMVITSSYTASLSSILTVQQLSTSVKGIESLITNDWPIGYQVGSFAYSYLSDSLRIQKSRLISLGSPEDYERALRQGPRNGGVAAIVDELPYVQLFLSNQTDFGIIGQPFTRSGWGFAFQRDSPLAVGMSTAILKLSENGMLQKLHEKWFCKEGCPEERRQHSEPHQLRLISFWGLYLLCGTITFTAFLVFLLRMVCQYVRYKQQQMHPHSPSSSSSFSTRYSKAVFNFFDFIDEKEEAIKKMFTQCDYPQVHGSSGR